MAYYNYENSRGRRRGGNPDMYQERGFDRSHDPTQYSGRRRGFGNMNTGWQGNTQNRFGGMTTNPYGQFGQQQGQEDYWGGNQNGMYGLQEIQNTEDRRRDRDRDRRRQRDGSERREEEERMQKEKEREERRRKREQEREEQEAKEERQRQRERDKEERRRKKEEEKEKEREKMREEMRKQEEKEKRQEERRKKKEEKEREKKEQQRRIQEEREREEARLEQEREREEMQRQHEENERRERERIMREEQRKQEEERLRQEQRRRDQEMMDEQQEMQRMMSMQKSKKRRDGNQQPTNWAGPPQENAPVASYDIIPVDAPLLGQVPTGPNMQVPEPQGFTSMGRRSLDYREPDSVYAGDSRRDKSGYGRQGIMHHGIDENFGDEDDGEDDDEDDDSSSSGSSGETDSDEDSSSSEEDTEEKLPKKKFPPPGPQEQYPPPGPQQEYPPPAPIQQDPAPPPVPQTPRIQIVPPTPYDQPYKYEMKFPNSPPGNQGPPPQGPPQSPWGANQKSPYQTPGKKGKSPKKNKKKGPKPEKDKFFYAQQALNKEDLNKFYDRYGRPKSQEQLIDEDYENQIDSKWRHKLRSTFARKQVELERKEKMEHESHKTCSQAIKAKFSMGKKKIQRSWKRFKDGASSLAFWRRGYKKIEGAFGSSVTSYFRFLVWLFFLDVFIAILMLAVVIAPQATPNPKEFSPVGVPENKYAVEAMQCSIDYDDMQFDNKSLGENVIDFFQGTGWMETTILFYGKYFNKTLTIAGYSEGRDYNMGLAYICSTIVYFGVSLIAMVRFISKASGERLLHDPRKTSSVANAVFGGWDYTLVFSSGKGNLKQKILFQEYKGFLSKAKIISEREQQSVAKTCGILLIRIFVNVAWVGCIAGVGASIYFASVKSPELQKIQLVQDVGFLSLLVEYLPSIVITAANITLPKFFGFIVQFEKYSPSTTDKITLVRIVFLRLFSIAFLFVTLFLLFFQCDEDERLCGVCQREETTIRCWETYVGQQLYQLVFLDFVVEIILTIVVEFPRKFLYDRYHEKSKLLQKIGLQEFDVAESVLDLVYYQSLCWIGTFYCPIIPFITVLQLFIYFFVRMGSSLKNYNPPSVPYRASKSNTFFIVILLVSYVLCLIPIAISVGWIPPSQSCGPFRVYSQEDYRMFTALSDGFSSLSPTAKAIYSFITNAIVILPLTFLLIMIIYYYSAKSSSNQALWKVLEQGLAKKEKDKEFLIRQIRERFLG